MQNSLDKPWTPAVFYPGSLNGSHNRIKLPFVERVTAGAPDQTRGTQTDTKRRKRRSTKRRKRSTERRKRRTNLHCWERLRRRGSFKVKA